MVYELLSDLNIGTNVHLTYDNLEKDDQKDQVQEDQKEVENAIDLRSLYKGIAVRNVYEIKV